MPKIGLVAPVASGLPAELQQVATKHFSEAAVGQRADVAKLEAEAAQKLEANGMTVHRPPPGLFRKALLQTKYYPTWLYKIRMNHAPILSASIAQDKAHTSASFRVPTHSLFD